MRKVWVPKEALIPKPFYKQKLFVFFCLLMFSSILFLAYQLYFVNQLGTTEMLNSDRNHQNHQNHQIHIEIEQPSPKRLEVNPKREITRGIRIKDIDRYRRLYSDEKFKCLDGSAEIVWEKLNDDFCDCLDGSDETFTSACANGKFYCTKQMRHKTGRGQDVFVVSSRINDGVCDCLLDCSDEFK